MEAVANELFNRVLCFLGSDFAMLTFRDMQLLAFGYAAVGLWKSRFSQKASASNNTAVVPCTCTA
jgi:hypothetical protein